MHRWKVGGAEIVRVEDSSFALPTDAAVAEWMVPHFAPSRTEIGIAFSALAIAVDGLRVVVDPWLADDSPRERPDADAHIERLLGELAAAGFAADDVDLVVNTHLDGIGWNTRPDGRGGWRPTFPNARYLYPDQELAAVAAGEELYGHEGLAALRRAGVLEATSHDRRLAEHLALVDAPGHNPGHVAVRVDGAGGELAIIPGHLVLSPLHVHDPGFDIGEVDLALASATRRRLFDELAEREGLLLTSMLGGSGGGRLSQEAASYRLDPVAPR
jgi:glyoxylase-like metal-dependent hydrolase (beta-lactamase superfamily II)